MAMPDDDDDDGIVDIIDSGVVLVRTSDDRTPMLGLVDNAVANDDDDKSHNERIDNMKQGRLRWGWWHWHRRRCCCRRNSGAATAVAAVMVMVSQRSADFLCGGGGELQPERKIWRARKIRKIWRARKIRKIWRARKILPQKIWRARKILLQKIWRARKILRVRAQRYDFPTQDRPNSLFPASSLPAKMVSRGHHRPGDIRVCLSFLFFPKGEVSRHY